MKVGIVANEFFDPNLGRMGGFGWVAWAAARAFRATDDIETVFLTTEFHVPGGECVSDGVRLLTPAGSNLEYAWRLRREGFDALLTVDWRPNYAKIVTALGRTPILVWVQDPRTPYDVRRVNSLRIPGVEAPPSGADAIDCTGLRWVVYQSRAVKRPLIMAGHAGYLEEKLEGTYGVRTEHYEFLPDPVDIPSVVRQPSTPPLVIFLGRTDPIKRPWLFFDLAESLPVADFAVLGQTHFSGSGSWTLPHASQNVALPGHVHEAEKFEWLSRASLLVNTSIHEALPISFLEALGCGVPIVSMQNPEELATRFGRYVGRFAGDGADGYSYLRRAVADLLDQPILLGQLGDAGRAWVNATHGRDKFVSQFRNLMSPKK